MAELHGEGLSDMFAYALTPQTLKRLWVAGYMASGMSYEDFVRTVVGQSVELGMNLFSVVEPGAMMQNDEYYMWRGDQIFDDLNAKFPRELYGGGKAMEAAKRRILRGQKSWGAESRALVKEMPSPKDAGLFATRTIKKGSTIAFYPIVLIDDPGADTTDPLRNYFIEVVYKGKQSALVGKPDLDAVTKRPSRGVPYTGLYSNEPYPEQRPNAEMVGRERRPVLGGKLLYSLKATRTIKKGEEITWCYGTEFDRGDPPYKTGCD